MKKKIIVRNILLLIVVACIAQQPLMQFVFANAELVEPEKEIKTNGENAEAEPPVETMDENAEVAPQQETITENMEVAPPVAATTETKVGTTINGITYAAGLVSGKMGVCGYDPAANPQHPNVVIEDTIDGKPVVTIEDNVFHKKQIKSVSIPDTVVSINSSAFRENELTSVKLPKELVFLGDMSFYKNQITSITIPGKVGTTTAGRWDKYAFANNKITSVVLEEGLVSLGTAAFINNEIASITFPSTLKTISFQAFAGNSLMTIDIPDTVDTIEGQAFYANGILAPNIPSSVTSVAADAFKDQGRNVESILKDDILSYNLPTSVDASKITMITPNVKVDVANKIITCPKEITEVIYQYSLGIYGGAEVSLPATLKLIPKVKVTFVDYDDSVLEQKVIDVAGTVQPTVVPSRSGYTFIGWDKTLTNITNSTTLKAKYKALPQIKANDRKIEIGAVFDPLQDVIATDADGNIITIIQVIENTVNSNQPGSYKVILEVIDSWGGKANKEYQVVVESKFNDRTLTESNTGIVAKGLFTKDARIIVEVIPVLDASLSQVLIDRDIIIGYEIRVEGEYTGEINIDFPIDEKLNGQRIMIYHEKSNGETETFESVVKNGKVNITVNELSPFVITKDKAIVKVVKTGDESKGIMYALLGLSSLILLLFLVLRAKLIQTKR